jgi:hypothetical protein
MGNQYVPMENPSIWGIYSEYYLGKFNHPSPGIMVFRNVEKGNHPKWP